MYRRYLSYLPNTPFAKKRKPIANHCECAGDEKGSEYSIITSGAPPPPSRVLLQHITTSTYVFRFIRRYAWCRSRFYFLTRVLYDSEGDSTSAHDQYVPFKSFLKLFCLNCKPTFLPSRPGGLGGDRKTQSPHQIRPIGGVFFFKDIFVLISAVFRFLPRVETIYCAI